MEYFCFSFRRFELDMYDIKIYFDSSWNMKLYGCFLELSPFFRCFFTRWLVPTIFELFLMIRNNTVLVIDAKVMGEKDMSIQIESDAEVELEIRICTAIDFLTIIPVSGLTSVNWDIFEQFSLDISFEEECLVRKRESIYDSSSIFCDRNVKWIINGCLQVLYDEDFYYFRMNSDMKLFLVAMVFSVDNVRKVRIVRGDVPKEYEFELMSLTGQHHYYKL